MLICNTGAEGTFVHNQSHYLFLTLIVKSGPNHGFMSPEMEFKEFEPRFKSAKTRFKLSADLNLETFDTILSGTNHI